MGPLCGKCKREDPLSYMKDSRCYHCEGGEVAVVVSVIVMFFAIPLAVALVLYRFTRARALTYRIYRRLFDIGRFKVVCVPVSPFRTLERLFSLLDLSLLRIMPVACIVPNYDFISDFYVRLRRSVRVLVGLGISH